MNFQHGCYRSLDLWATYVLWGKNPQLVVEAEKGEAA